MDRRGPEEGVGRKAGVEEGACRIGRRRGPAGGRGRRPGRTRGHTLSHAMLVKHGNAL